MIKYKMVEGHIIFNAIVYAAIIAYILYINFAAYYNKTPGALNWLVNLFQNWIFRLVFLLVVGFFSLDLFPFGGFVFAVLLTIAFLNTNMLMYKKDVSESFSSEMSNDVQSAANCGRYAPIQRLPFNPQGYRPDDSVLDSGAPDQLPDDSVANGPYTDSGIGYQFNMA